MDKRVRGEWNRKRDERLKQKVSGVRPMHHTDKEWRRSQTASLAGPRDNDTGGPSPVF